MSEGHWYMLSGDTPFFSPTPRTDLGPEIPAPDLVVVHGNDVLIDNGTDEPTKVPIQEFTDEGNKQPKKKGGKKK